LYQRDKKLRALAYAELGSRAALDDTLGHVSNDSGYRAAWDRLLPADKAVLRALAQDVSDLHSLAAPHYQIQDEGFVEWLRWLELEE
jgi:hypothetical protein